MIEIKKYKGDFSDLDGLKLNDQPIAGFKGLTAGYDLFVGYVDGQPQSCFFLSEPDTSLALKPFAAKPYLAYFFNGGDLTLKEATLAAIKQAVRELGADSFFAVNASETADDAWARAFKTAGVATKAGTFFSFDVGA